MSTPFLGSRAKVRTYIGGPPGIDIGRREMLIPGRDRDIHGEGPGELVDMGCDEYVDIDVDELPAWWELAYFNSRTTGRTAPAGNLPGLWGYGLETRSTGHRLDTGATVKPVPARDTANTGE